MPTETPTSADRPTRGLFIGRFQPFHKGHLDAVRHILERYDEVIVGLARGEENFQPENPFTVGERIEMIWQSLDGPTRGRCLVSPLNDRRNNRIWVDYTKHSLPAFDAVFTNNPYTAVLMKNGGVPIEPIQPSLEICASEIRRRIIESDPTWQDLVPEAVAQLLARLGAKERLRVLAVKEDR